MKINTLAIILMAITLLSCSKEESNNEIDVYGVSCNISVFSQTIEDIKGSIPLKSTTNSDLSSYINSYHYKIWKLTGSDDEALKDSKTVIIGGSNSTENKIESVLSSGKYHIMIVGNSYENESDWNNSDYLFECKNINNGSVFVISKSFEVTDSELDLNLVFKRLSSKLRIKFLNQLPEDITKIEIYSQNIIDNVGGYFYDSKFGFRTRGEEHSIFVDRNNDNIYDFDLLPYTKDWFAELSSDGITDYADLVFQTSNFYTIHLNLKYKDSNDNVIKEQDIENILLLPNQRTIMTGNYVGVGEIENSFAFTLDASWGDDINTSF